MNPDAESLPSMASMPTAALPRAGRSGRPDGVLGRVDHYEIVRKLGGGGFGVVYLARDTVGGIDVALKTLHPLLKRNAEEMDKLREKFALVSRLSHPNAATALVLHPCRDVAIRDPGARRELGLSPGDPVMVMRYAPGVTLSKWRRQFPGGAVPPETACEIARQIASALDCAHAERIVHRDVKPSNAMVETLEDGNVRVRLLDFGLAAEIRSSMSRVSNEIGDTSGTRPYMAPEQWSGRVQDGRADQYALACVVYEMLSGEPPFAGVFETGDPAIMRSAVLSERPRPVAGLPRAANEALLRALEKLPGDRFPTCEAFAEALSSSVGRGGVIPGSLLFGRFFGGERPSSRTTGSSPAVAPSAPSAATVPPTATASTVSGPAPAATVRPRLLRRLAPAAVAAAAIAAVAVAVLRNPGPGSTPASGTDDLAERRLALEKCRTSVRNWLDETKGYSTWTEAPYSSRRDEIADGARRLESSGFTPDEIDAARRICAASEQARDWMVSNARSRRTAAGEMAAFGDLRSELAGKPFGRFVPEEDRNLAETAKAEAEGLFAKGDYSGAVALFSRARADLEKAGKETEARVLRLAELKNQAAETAASVSGTGKWTDAEWKGLLRTFGGLEAALKSATPDPRGLEKAEKDFEGLRAAAQRLKDADVSRRREADADAAAVAEIGRLKDAASKRKAELDRLAWSDEAWVAMRKSAGKAFARLSSCKGADAVSEARSAAADFADAAKWMEDRSGDRLDLDNAEKDPMATCKPPKFGESDGELSLKWKTASDAISGAGELKKSGRYADAAKAVGDGCKMRREVLGALKISAETGDRLSKILAAARRYREEKNWQTLLDAAVLALGIDPGNPEAARFAEEARAMGATD